MMKQVMMLEGVHTARFDFYELGMETIDANGEKQAAKNCTAVMTNSSDLAEALRQAQCKGLRKHQHLAQGRASACQVYPQPFIDLIVSVIEKEICDAHLRQKM